MGDLSRVGPCGATIHELLVGNESEVSINTSAEGLLAEPRKSGSLGNLTHLWETSFASFSFATISPSGGDFLLSCGSDTGLPPMSCPSPRSTP